MSVSLAFAVPSKRHPLTALHEWRAAGSDSNDGNVQEIN